MKNYIRIARPDHWVKNIFIIPGLAVGFLLADMPPLGELLYRFVIGFIATCMIASANYVINEWLDAEFDKYHPTKKYRPVVSENMKFSLVMLEYVLLAVVGIALSCLINKGFLATEIWLLVMGIIYNVKPMRTKDIPFLDVISESVNNMIRLLLGWFIVTDASVPPGSILLGYWMGGAFLMGIKRFAEYRMIGDPRTAGLCGIYGEDASLLQYVLRLLLHLLYGTLPCEIQDRICARHAVSFPAFRLLSVHSLQG